MVQAFGAVSEVIVCCMSPLLLAANGMRSAVLAFFYFQYVARRYQHSFWTKQVNSMPALARVVVGSPAGNGAERLA